MLEAISQQVIHPKTFLKFVLNSPNLLFFLFKFRGIVIFIFSKIIISIFLSLFFIYLLLIIILICDLSSPLSSFFFFFLVFYLVRCYFVFIALRHLLLLKLLLLRLLTWCCILNFVLLELGLLHHLLLSLIVNYFWARTLLQSNCVSKSIKSVISRS